MSDGDSRRGRNQKNKETGRFSYRWTTWSSKSLCRRKQTRIRSRRSTRPPPNSPQKTLRTATACRSTSSPHCWAQMWSSQLRFSGSLRRRRWARGGLLEGGVTENRSRSAEINCTAAVAVNPLKTACKKLHTPKVWAQLHTENHHHHLELPAQTGPVHRPLRAEGTSCHRASLE